MVSQQSTVKTESRAQRKAYEKALAIHGPSSAHWAPRHNFFVQPVPALDTAADRLFHAANALRAGDYEMAREMVRQAEIPELVDHAVAPIMSTVRPDILRWRPIDATSLPPKGRVDNLSPSPSNRSKAMVEMLDKMYFRDGWRCRFCGCRVIRPEARDKMKALLPNCIR